MKKLKINVFKDVQICLNILNYKYGIFKFEATLGTLLCVHGNFDGWKTYASDCTAWIENWWKLAKDIDHFSHPK